MITSLYYLCISIFFPILKQHESSKVRLQKVEKSSFERACERVCPYIILACTIILCVLLFVVLVKYGHTITGTESNTYYYHLK